MLVRALLIVGLAAAASSGAFAQAAPTAVPSCDPPSTMELQVTLRPQKTGMWCWAASGQMVMEYLGKSVEQCIQANYRLHRSDCCNSPTPDECVSGGWPEFERYGFQFKRTNGTPLTWNQLRSQLAAKKVGEPCSFTPFAFSWRWIGNGGHMMVATGYTTTPDGKNYVHVNDPWEPNIGATRTILYEVYDQLPGDHTHWDDFYDIR
ncbi:hypothetical protein CO683_23725 [Bradyrhizobium ottawaense]|jgi:hypothetical protein|uniref:C39 family peptidase n=1 Tax=Bradyrhizobium TaxID=374 RepID=UPI000576C493|nr:MULTISPECIES: papain-like cysteine protease family protein [Bradyrhizobium]MBR1328716.1 C39 family peptidase [Bradyrhizobium ottawaense]MBR1334464.1 C39 family peptidase [Bradyrhizobium ottawaense]MBR1360618.1 C39 family peptidase [Bradyrhizobium ottawaense]PDT66961.1 hypothetical protein CO683_23725 [Bradyrhizobium ottawaense]BBO14896.1 hypothetical protein TM102_63660 [Bradyrhizobium sp. TM102]